MDKQIPDEWTFIRRHGGPRNQWAINMLRSHWESFVTEYDLDRLKTFGVTHVRVPVGWWLVEDGVAEGFITGGEIFLRRLVGWLHLRDMKAVLDMHALPCAQAEDESFTGKKTHFFRFFS